MVSQKTLMDYTLFLQKHFSSIIVSFCIAANGIAQLPQKVFYQDSIQTCKTDEQVKNKTIPTEFENQVKIALSYYPELENVKIKFRVKKKVSPLAARPNFWAMFHKASNRKYIITVSSKTIDKLEPILLKNLSFNAQIGVLGHEIGHVSIYDKKRGAYFIQLVFMHLSKKQIDVAEYETDKTCIEHGLGYQLLAWSIEVREKLALLQWSGSNSITGERERYMNPETIRKYMNELTIYK